MNYLGRISIVNLTTFDAGSLSTHPVVLLIQSNRLQITNATHQLIKLAYAEDDLTGAEWAAVEVLF